MKMIKSNHCTYSEDCYPALPLLSPIPPLNLNTFLSEVLDIESRHGIAEVPQVIPACS